MAKLVEYVKTVWENGKTALNAARMNNMEQGISNCATQINKLGDSVCQREFVAKANNSRDATFTVSGWDDGLYYIIGASPFSKTEAFSDAMIHVLEGKPYVQSLHGNVSLSGDTITVQGDAWYTYVVKFLITNFK